MASLNDSNTTDQYDQAQVVLMGGTDNTKIGNVGDKLKVDAQITAGVVVISDVESTFRPDPSGYETDEQSTLKLDSSRNLITRSAVHVDEGSFRTDFNDLLETALTGTLTFVNGNATVTGVGTAFLSELLAENYIKLDVDGTTLYTQIFKLISDTEVELYEGYLGTSASGAAKLSKWRFSYSGTGSNISIGSSLITLNAGTANGGYARIERNIDYCPLQLYADFSVALRQADQEVIFGFTDDIDTPTRSAVVILSGTSETNVMFRTRSGASAVEETNIVLGITDSSAQMIDYEINVLPSKCVLIINGRIRATHTDRIPFPYDVLKVIALSRNTGVVLSNAVNIDVAYVSNVNIVAISNTFAGEPLKVQIIPSESVSQKGFIDGFIQTASSSTTMIRSTTYNEQTSAAQRSFKSTDNDDMAGDTGARTLKLIYYDNNMVGPYSEIITLNGTTAVNTVATNIRFVEQIEVLTAGSSGAAEGTITMYTTTGGGGTAIGTIAATSTRTFWCHHYVPPGFTCNISGVTVSTSGTVFGNGGNFYMTSTPVLTTGYINQQISDNLVVPGAVPFSSRIYPTPIQVLGPSRVTGWIKPNGTATYNNYMSFDYYEE